MRLDLTAEDRVFRERARVWLAANLPAEPRPQGGAALREFDLEWIRRQWHGGWSGIAWPREVGGSGATPLQQMLWYEACADLEAPPVGVGMVGLNFGGPTLISCGTAQQRRDHLPMILRGEAVWCQGFSEPGAGSDLASISTRGVVKDDHIEVTGQKIWTSYADVADYQILLVRTDPESKKHRGLTMVICDMHSSGIVVRPIRLMSGEAHFCEVFYDGVKVSRENVIGEIGQGWAVALTTLGFERGAAFIADQVALARKVELLAEMAALAEWPERGLVAIKDQGVARQIARLRAQVSGLRAFSYAEVNKRDVGIPPGPNGSMLKLYYSQTAQILYQNAFDILGDRSSHFEYGNEGWTRDYLYSFAMSIGGGTSEIQREIIANRILNLPR